ncbi:SulP family inorganic anion transporter [Mycolicibacterium diernhoferi]|uniref:Sodium-independent anion transporter n=1 Tax=Mycolicibacterium diernhoferi TaxID=1801 RepID=A0A1Q4HEM6_9MYCO|nr:SulP family inorganic anion transporter [Mycolicibacterium diernhoferi]OJZ65973.1 sodium-independent anion transporter [Mycolicibacterium diernhoferi]OPE45425.1 sodium-independent anion transporter [Mycolicibacterium diernhoferi]PEG53343.1 SulP family inorganic anion transporter [Mycolicibacterium diernhoferi]QYL23879.1 SulP family inorganic anion transporter [Mycolicibacterium diernhoferi]
MPPQERPADSPSVRSALRSPRRLKTEVLAGLVVALALIPEAISFSIIAGVDPRVGLFASVTMAVTIAIVGGRPAMISAATGAIALVIAPLAREYGVDYFVAAVIFAGALQVLLSVLGVARLMRFIPRSVMVGFVNALAILIFTAQLPHLLGVPTLVYPFVAVALLILILLPKLTTAVPAPLVAIVLLTAAVVVFGLDIPNVADQGDLPTSLPALFLPQVPLTWETLQIVGPYALAMALVGLLESLMTAKLVDDITDTPSDKTREGWGQGVANLVTGFFGGMGGCAMIGQTMINVKVSGARTRISTFLAGIFLLILVVGLGDVVGLIPMAALVAVMIMVSVATFDWHSINPVTLRRMPRSETLVMLATVAVTVVTHNLAYGVIVGSVTAMVLFARRVAHFMTVERVIDEGAGAEAARVTYRVSGELFFASSNDLVYQFDYAADPHSVVIDVSRSHIWDASTVAALDAITTKYRARGKHVDIVGLNSDSAQRHDRLSGQLGLDH